MALEATHVLELNIERLSQGANKTKCWCPHKFSCFWGRLQERHAWSPSPHRPRRHVTFCELEEETSYDGAPERTLGEATRGEVEESNLGPLPTLWPELEHFLEMPTTSQGTRDRWSFLPELSIENYDQWLEWKAHQLDTPHWWEELTTILGVGDVKRLAQKICASFKVPAVRHEVFKGQVFTVPPAPKCINRNMFLMDDLSYQDVQLKPHWMTLAYAQVLQYWVEEANPLAPSEPHPLAMSVCELRWHMGKYTTFCYHDVFKGLVRALPRAMVKETHPSPMGTPPADGLTASSSSSKAEVEEYTPVQSYRNSTGG